MPRRRHESSSDSSDGSDEDDHRRRGDKRASKKRNAARMAMNQLMLVSLLDQCQRVKNKRARKRASSSDEESDSDYEPSDEDSPSSSDSASDCDDDSESSGDDEKQKGSRRKAGSTRRRRKDDDYDSDSDGDAKKSGASRRKARTTRKKDKGVSRRSQRRSSEKALSRLRGGVLDDDEVRYLKKLDKRSQARYELAAKKVTRKVRNNQPLLFRVLEWECPERTKAMICERMTRFEEMEPGEGEHPKLAAWLSGVESLPIGVHQKLPVNVKADPPAKVAEFLRTARTTLDDAIFGHDHAKDAIVRLCAQWIRNPNAPTQPLAIQGPMGNGKTTLVKNGIAKVMHRPFTFIALGGAHDASFLTGYDYTYEGARPGRIADAVKNAGCMNPVIFLDELDKLSDTPRGREIQQTLVHLLDGSQNSHFATDTLTASTSTYRAPSLWCRSTTRPRSTASCSTECGSW